MEDGCPQLWAGRHPESRPVGLSQSRQWTAGRGVARGCLGTSGARPGLIVALVSAEVRPDCAGAPGGEEAGAGLPPVPPE